MKAKKYFYTLTKEKGNWYVFGTLLIRKGRKPAYLLGFRPFHLHSHSQNET